MDHNKQTLTFVLLCSGNGADSSIYRPNIDDKRYRHRQDALVRCVAVTLFSAAGASALTSGRSCELILLYDEDKSYMKMSMTKSRESVADIVEQPWPLEKYVVSAWKNAANEASRLRQQQHITSIGTMGSSFTRSGGNSNASESFQLVTKCILDDESPINQPAANKSKTKLPSHMPASKRDAITMLQSTCSLEFLRTHHLNVPLAVALKKFNKNKLQAVWDDAKKHDSASSSDSTPQRLDDKTERTFYDILSKAKGNVSANEYTTDVLAAYLHESCDSELPCWSNALHDRNKEVKHIFLFCGAVRDMTDMENASLSNVCKTLKVPLLPCRLGPVPEFTSKIISVAGYHFYKGLLGSGLVKLWEQKQRNEKALESIASQSNNVSHKRSLHTIAIVPIDSTSLTADPSKRCRVHWCIVRLCVCSLYRSKFASTTRDALDNKLSFVFQDGLTMNLDQRDFISSLAEKHQAAPSERQILEELCRRRDDLLAQEECNNDINHLISSYEQKNAGDVYALDFIDTLHRKPKREEVIELAYTGDCSSGESCDASLLAILQIRDPKGKANDKVERMHERLIDAIEKAGIQMKEQSLLVREAQDGEALTVIMLQHLDYQSKLFGLLQHMFRASSPKAIVRDVGTTEENGRKRKKKQKNDKKKKSKKKHSKHS